MPQDGFDTAHHGLMYRLEGILKEKLYGFYLLTSAAAILKVIFSHDNHMSMQPVLVCR